MNYRGGLIVAVLILSAGLGAISPYLVGDLQRRLQRSERQAELAALAPDLGQGLTIAALGGYRSIAANLVWIRMHEDWRRRLRGETLSKISLAVALNPDSAFFWIGGARVIAYDMPVWEVGEEAMGSLFQTEAGNAIRRRYAQLALDFLNQAPEALQDTQAVLREKAVISWQRLGDLDAALGYLESILQQENPPAYIGRLYAELLVRSGRVSEAYDFLRERYRQWSRNDPKAMKEQVAERIKELRRRLEDER